MVNLGSLPDPLGFLLSVFAQEAPGGGDIVTNILAGLGAGGLPAGILWYVYRESTKRHVEREARLHEQLDESRAENRALTSRLFLLADRGMAVGQTASEVVKGESNDPELLAQMQRLEALLEQRGSR